MEIKYVTDGGEGRMGISAASALAARRTVTEKPCAHCGKPFEGIVVARYCSAACRVTACRQRKRARERGG